MEVPIDEKGDGSEKARSKRKPTFKPYFQSQPCLLPSSLDELIPKHHPVRVVNSVIDSLDLSGIIAGYEGGGASPYHPAMLLKVVVFAYLRNIYSSRKMEEALAENVHFMWLSGRSLPDHNTLARFRGDRLRLQMREIFSQVVLLLSEAGLVSLEESYVDGTKLEANAGRYTFVWGKSIQTRKAKMVERLNEVLAYVDKVCDLETPSEPITFEKINPEAVQATVAKINELLRDKEVPKEIQSTLSTGKNWPKALEVYEAQEKILGKRGSYSKTDPGATFMRMKEDRNNPKAVPKPGYNLQISTESQLVTHYSIHPNPTDTLTLIPHLEGFREALGKVPKNLIADAGYGSEENYQYLASAGVEAYVLYNTYYSEQKDGGPFEASHWPYDPQNDTYLCPAGKLFTRSGSHTARNDNGYLHTYANYQSPGCSGCPFLRQCCGKDKQERSLSVNTTLNRYKHEVRERLQSEEGVKRRKRRGCEVESVFGNIKANKQFRRCSLRGADKVEAEVGILLLSHNLKKLAA